MDDPPDLSQAAPSAKHILIVEDESIVALSESFMLRKKGYAVDIANSGEAAIASLEGGLAPDLILMDIDLGNGMDGTAAASAILERWEMPIVFLTSHSSKEMVDKVRGITRYGYIIKNSGDFVMLSTIEMAFDLFSKERVIAEKNALLRRAEKAARIGYWFVEKGNSEIALSEGSRAILGVESEACSFDDFERNVLAGGSAPRAAAFRMLLERGQPYDISYKVRRADTGAVATIRSSGRVCGDAILGVFQDISDIEGLLVDLRKSEARQAVTLRSIGDGVISTDTVGRVVELNREAERLTGWSNDEALGLPLAEVFRIVNASTRKAVENPVQKVIDTGYVVGLANHTVLIARDGSERHIADSAAPIRDDDDAVLGVVLVFRDITPDYEAQEMVKRSEGIFRTLFDEAHTPMLLIDPESGSIEGANRASSRFYGWSIEELRSKGIADLNVLPSADIANAMREAVKADQKEFQFLHRSAEGEQKRVLVTSGPIQVDGRTRLLSIIRDATDKHELEMKLSAERKRSGVIQRDARHRMKNSAQMIASLIQLQLSGMEDEGAAEALGILLSRVIGLSMVYDQLYVEDDRERVGSAAYLGALLEAVEASYVPESVRLRREIEDIVLEARFAVSLGLIVGELVINACKYAFPDAREGSVSVAFGRGPDGSIALSVSDDGIGMEAARRRAGKVQRDGTGLSIVRSLVEQESGKIEIDRRNAGASIACSFPGAPSMN